MTSIDDYAAHIGGLTTDRLANTTEGKGKVIYLIDHWQKGGGTRTSKRTVSSQTKTTVEQSLIVRRILNMKGELAQARLEIKSKYLVQLLKETVCKRYPNTAAESDKIIIISPYHALAVCWTDIKSQHSTDLANSPTRSFELRKEFKWLEDFMMVDADIQKSMNVYAQVQENQARTALFADLWAILPPQTIIYSKKSGVGECFRVLGSYSSYSSRGRGDDPDLFNIECAQVVFENGQFDLKKTGTMQIQSFKGSRETSTLEFFPLKVSPAQEEIRSERRRDSSTWLNLAADRHYNYNSVAWIEEENEQEKISALEKTFLSIWGDDTEETSTDKCVPIHGKIILDLPNISSCNPAAPSLKEDEDLIFPARIQGYSLESATLAKLLISKLEKIDWRENSMDMITMGKQQQEIVLMLKLVRLHLDRLGTEDAQNGVKGKGLPILLYGPPGLGKTLVAELMAEAVRKPLYKISSGELGLKRAVDKDLKIVFDRAFEWKAILLIDEADIFLKNRESQIGSETGRRDQIEAFLRHVEYFPGVLFLCTNMMTDFDAAVMSRMRMTLRFELPEREQRLAIWAKQMDAMSVKGMKVEEADDAASFILGATNLSGRAINSIVNLVVDLTSIDISVAGIEAVKTASKLLRMPESI